MKSPEYMEKIDIKNLSEDELEGKLKRLGAEGFRARQIFGWLYKSGARSFDEMTDLPYELRKTLREKFHISHLAMLDSKRSFLDGTAKYLFKLEDSNAIETVLIPERRRNTICLSSQVGCKFSCSFCASAPFGFVRNLTVAEILNQVIKLQTLNPAVSVTNLVFMGIGEPLDNYDNVIKAIRVFNHRDALHIGARRMTVSTCGITPGIERLKNEDLQLELSVSLHSPDDGVRSKLVPINKRYPLSGLIGACKDYIEKTGRVVTFEYVLIKGVNSSREDALKLVRLLKGVKCKVNTISCNQIAAKDYEGPSESAVRIFIKTLKDGGIAATHRKSKGEDIDAGCGQLRISRM